MDKKIEIRLATIADYDGILELWNNEAANAFWERQGYTLRTNLNYRNKSLNSAVPQGE